MALDSIALLAFTNGLNSTFVASAVPVSPPDFPGPFSLLYKTYALNAVSCAGAPPSLVFETKLRDRIIEGSLEATAEGAAEKWALGFKEFWENALFGPTGLVLPGDEGDCSALESALAGLWTAQAATLTTFAASALQHCTLFEAYTKTVEVKDTALPTPPGCGPSPII